MQSWAEAVQEAHGGSPDRQPGWREAPCEEGVVEDLLGGGALGRVWVEQLGDEGTGLVAERGGDAVLVVLDTLVGLFQTLCLEGRPAYQQGVAGGKRQSYDTVLLVAPATTSLRRHTHRTHPMDQMSTS